MSEQLSPAFKEAIVKDFRTDCGLCALAHKYKISNQAIKDVLNELVPQELTAYQAMLRKGPVKRDTYIRRDEKIKGIHYVRGDQA
jgi:predicted DNA-binding protein YlxM (UPF0122 family)